MKPTNRREWYQIVLLEDPLADTQKEDNRQHHRRNKSKKKMLIDEKKQHKLFPKKFLMKREKNH